MTRFQFESRQRFGIRTLALGTCSVLIGASLFGQSVLAEQVNGEEFQPVVEVSLEKTEATEKQEEKATEVVENPVKPSEEATVLDGEKLEKLENEQLEENAAPKDTVIEVTDTPVEEVESIRPKEIKFDTWQDVLTWEPGKRQDDAVNRGSVAIVERHKGHLINEKASEEAKVEALANTNSKAKDHASVGGEEFKAYAFDYWQYVDSMVFWEGLIPSPDVIDAGHRNGVPVLGTIFYNWSSSIEDQEKFVASLQQDEKGDFPVARKLVDMAKYYGFDGYFINQETTGNLVEPLGEKMRNFMLYSKKYAESIGYPIRLSWYDAMTYYYGRYHEDGLGEYNYQFMEKEGTGQSVPADHFFANFNWNKEKNDQSVAVAKHLGRNPYDVFAGLELQRGGSYKTQVNWDALFDKNGKLRLSLGLFAPDTITSLGKTGEDYHENENIFFTGHQGDPSAQKPADKQWYGIANLVADKTPITSSQFYTSFNTGHGKKWFVDGKVSKDSEWNYRSVTGILPTWRWWIQSSGDKLKASYDFDDAYNGGSSLRFTGDIGQNTKQEMKLYSTKIPISTTSKLRVAHKGGQGATIQLALATEPNYQFADKNAWKTLQLSDQWHEEVFDLSSLAGQTIYAIQAVVENEQALSAYDFHLGQLAIYQDDTPPTAPQAAKVVNKQLKNAQEAEAIIDFVGSPEADYYEVYAKDEGVWKILTGSSNTTIYLQKLTRSSSEEGQEQALKVIAVGKNGLRSTATQFTFDWGMTVQDTSLPRPLAPNVVLGASVIDSSFGAKAGGEDIEGMLNGTITSLSDKWSSSQLSGHVDIRLTQPRTIVRWAMDHAGAGGESVNDGLMNTKDFDLYYKNDAGQWLLAKAVRGNREHVSDIILDQPIHAQDWRLKILTADNGTPWKAIRIYNWRMYEHLDTETINIPMTKAAARHLGNNHVQVGFREVPQNATIALFSSPQKTESLLQITSSEGGTVVLPTVELETLPSLLYYRTKLPGKEWSNLLAIPLPKEEKEIQTISLESDLSKKVYHIGDALSLVGGKIRVQFGGEKPDEIISFSNPAIKISGFDSQKVGEHILTLTYLNQQLAQNIRVFTVEASEQGKKMLVGLEIKQLPQTRYTVGDNLDIENGRLALIYDDGSQQLLDFTADGVTLVGFDQDKEGRQTLTLTYQGKEIQFDVLVSPKPIVNDEYLKQKMAEVEALKETLLYQFANPKHQLAVIEALQKAKDVVDHKERTAEEVEQAQTLLDKFVAELDGEHHYQQAKQLLNALMTETLALLQENIEDTILQLKADTELLLSSDKGKPETFTDLTEKWQITLNRLKDKNSSDNKSENGGSKDSPIVPLVPSPKEETPPTNEDKNDSSSQSNETPKKEGQPLLDQEGQKPPKDTSQNQKEPLSLTPNKGLPISNETRQKTPSLLRTSELQKNSSLSESNSSQLSGQVAPVETTMKVRTDLHRENRQDLPKTGDSQRGEMLYLSLGLLLLLVSEDRKKKLTK